MPSKMAGAPDFRPKVVLISISFLFGLCGRKEARSYSDRASARVELCSDVSLQFPARLPRRSAWSLQGMSPFLTLVSSAQFVTDMFLCQLNPAIVHSLCLDGRRRTDKRADGMYVCVCVCVSICVRMQVGILIDLYGYIRASVCLSVCPPVPVCLFICLCLSVSVCVCVSVCVSVYLSLSVCLSVCLSVYVCLSG